MNEHLAELEKLHAELERFIARRRDADAIRDVVTRLEWAHVRMGIEAEHGRSSKEKALSLH